MNDINVVIMGGNLVRDARVEYLPSGTPVGRFQICNHTYVGKNADGSAKVQNYFLDCQWLSKRAAAVQHMLVQGRHVTVTGELRQYTPEGQKFPRDYIEVQDVKFTPVSDRAGQGGFSDAPQREAPAVPPSPAAAPVATPSPRTTPVPVARAQPGAAQHAPQRVNPADGSSHQRPANHGYGVRTPPAAVATPARQPAVPHSSGQDFDDDPDWAFPRD